MRATKKIISVSILIAYLLIYSFAYALYSASTLVSMTNNQRSQNGVAALSVNQMLTNAALAKANDMFAKGYFAHTSPDGKTPWDFIHEAGYNYTYAGENLAIGYSDASDLMNDWMNSPTHRENILNVNFKEIGIAVVSGNYNGADTIIAVQEFGTSPSSPVQSQSQTNNSDTNSTAASSIGINRDKSSINPTSVFAGEEVTFTVTYFGSVKKAEITVGNNKFNILEGQNTANSDNEKTYSLKKKIDQIGTLDVVVTLYDNNGNQKTGSLGKLEVKPTVLAKNTENTPLFAGYFSTSALIGLAVFSGVLIAALVYLVVRKTRLQKIIKTGAAVWEF